MDGVLVIDKPSGCTSHDVVSRVKRMLRAKKVGHLGTLDPMATGVLPLVINRATKWATKLEGSEKEYLAVMKLGEETDTQDAEGQVIATKGFDGIGSDEIKEVFARFTGKVEQLPPMYSAVKKNGVPLYKLARKGITIERTPKLIEIEEIELQKLELPFVTFRVACSRGTYIRTLCSDIGEALGTHAHLTSLRRTVSGRFKVDSALALNISGAELKAGIIPLELFEAEEASLTKDTDMSSDEKVRTASA
ncbi:MAG: tRNA pseudouridine(55) synthase TruB [Deltaproteobacteria bacterium]|nr:tRNA pseudouridine(55) synthase TruB [Deltaproteobacteria bacterium]